MVHINFILETERIKSWIKTENIETSTILMILKKTLGYKNLGEILKNTGLDACFLRVRLCWKTESEYNEIICILNEIVQVFLESLKGKKSCHIYSYHRGKFLLYYRNIGGILSFVGYPEGNEPKALIYWTIEKTIERWIKEKF